MTRFTTRFAPSPTGYLHIGHAFSARCAFDRAKAEGGTCIVRIEDTDTTRCRPEFDAALIDDLTWLGFAWPTPVRRQSAHLNDYHKALLVLEKKGLIYRCFKTRRELMTQIASAPHDAQSGSLHGDKPFTGGPLPEPQETEKIASGAPYAWRLSMNRCRDYLGNDWSNLAFDEQGAGPDGQTGSIKAQPDQFGDAIIARKDTHTSYHLACVHDDALQAITHVVRGHDLFAVTHLHVLLQRLLDYPTPAYCHHPLLADEKANRLAKRSGATTLQSMRANGMSPADIWAKCDRLTKI